MTVTEWIESGRAPLKLYPLQRKILRTAFPLRGGGPTLTAVSMPRGGGKSTLLGHVLACAMAKGSPLYEAGSESVMLAASLEQARLVFRVMKQRLLDEEIPGLTFADSLVRIRANEAATGTAVVVRSSDPKKAMGLGVSCRLVVGDEPGAWEARAGALMHDTITTSLGKADRTRTQAIYIGTRAPSDPGSWWQRLLDAGSNERVVVFDRTGLPERWSDWRHVLSMNPLARTSGVLRDQLRSEMRQAKKDPDARKRFQLFRLNCRMRGGSDERPLVDLADWERVKQAPVKEPTGDLVVGVDMGGARGWSAAVAVWRSGRVDAFALCPQTAAWAAKEDALPERSYQVLVEDGSLVESGVRQPTAAMMVDEVLRRWGAPAVMLCDRFRLPEIADAARGRFMLDSRVGRWSESTEDIAATRRFLLDRDLSIAPASKRILEFALSQSVVEEDTSGNMRLKKVRGARSRDDVADGLILALGAWDRELRVDRTVRYHGGA